VWQQKAKDFFANKWTNFSKLDLAYCNGIWDYKANNFIYDDKNKPVLVDPDNAGRIHRLFDLALTLVLFHNEHLSAPGRVFTLNEWQLFLEGYNEFVKITEAERKAWQNYLEMVFYDEAVWLIRNDLEIGKNEPHKINDNQLNFIKDLICFEPEKYLI